jgi:hypothetical protein
MRVSYNNYFDLALGSALIPLSESPSYPCVNLQEQRLSTIYRTIDLTAQTVTIDLGTACSVSTVAIIAHNFTSSATVTVAANSSNSWGSPATSKTVTWNADMMLNFFTPVSYQWWQLQFDDQTNPDGYVGIGRFWLGDYLTIDPSSEVDFTITKKRSDRVIHGRGQQKFGSIGVGWREFKLSFPNTNYTMVDQISDMYDTVGNHQSFIFCNYDSIRDISKLVEPTYVSITNNLVFKHVEGRKFNYDIQLQEEL